jgi:PPM family protein phosphatase
VVATRVLKCAANSHPGLQRENNEDRFHIDPERGLFIVIDGIGGQAAGEVAAETASRLLRERLERQTGTVEERLREAITLANNEIYRLAQSREDWRGMACVLTAAVVENSHVTIGHVGDTRLYKIHNREIRKLTPDHSPTGVREDAGELSESEAMTHPRRNEVYRDVGSLQHSPDDEEFVDIIESNFEQDSALLLCSDGLTDLVNSSRILEIVEQKGSDPAAAVNGLIEAANLAGGKDNVTAVLIEGESFVSNLSLRSVADLERTAELSDTTVRSIDTSDSSHERQTFGKLAGSRWAFFIYGAIVALGVSLATQKLFNLSLVSQPPLPTTGYAPRVLVVSQHGESPFSSISDALVQAQAGDIIQVAPGEYRERLQLKNGIALVSLKPREAIILPFEATQQSVVDARNINNARFAGFLLRSEAQSPLSVGLQIANATITVEDVEILGMQTAGIEITGTGSAILRANYIHDNSGTGLVIAGKQSRVRVVQNVIIRNGKLNQQLRPGVELVDQAKPDLIGNYIADNGITGIVGLSTESQDDVMEKNLFGLSRLENTNRSSNNRRRGR